MAVKFALPEMRRIAMPWDPSYPTAYILLVFPVFALVWAAVGLLGAQESLADTDKRLEMTEEELREWRIEKLDR